MAEFSGVLPRKIPVDKVIYHRNGEFDPSREVMWVSRKMSPQMTQPAEDLWIVLVRFAPDKPEMPYSIPMSYQMAHAHMEDGKRNDKVEKVNHSYRLIRADDWQ